MSADKKMDKTQKLAIIPARGGSKRIPGKNIRSFCGKPVIAYPIEAALSSGLFDEVMVSTDSEEIGRIAQEYGASVPFMRSEKTSGDFAITAEVTREVASRYEGKWHVFDWVCSIYPTAPFVTARHLQEAFAALEGSGGDELFTVVRFSFPPQRGFVIGEDGRLDYKWPEHYATRSQDLEPLYHDAGQFYINRFRRVRDWKPGTVPERAVPYILRESEVQDIDTEEDWKLAEAKWRVLHEWHG